MQDVQNIPNPDVDSVEIGEGNTGDFGNHSDVLPEPRNNQDSDVERPIDDIPLPPDDLPPMPVEDPPEERERPPVDEDNTRGQMFV